MGVWGLEVIKVGLGSHRGGAQGGLELLNVGFGGLEVIKVGFTGGRSALASPMVGLEAPQPTPWWVFRRLELLNQPQSVFFELGAPQHEILELRAPTVGFFEPGLPQPVFFRNLKLLPMVFF